MLVGETKAMNSKEIYNIVLQTIEKQNNIRLDDSRFDENNFGNFVISFVCGSRRSSIVSDRGEIVICDDFGGMGNCRTILPTSRYAQEVEIISAVTEAL